MNVTQIVLASGSKLIRAQPASPDGGIRFIGVDTGDQEPPPLLRILDGPALAARIGIRLLSPVAFENYTGAALDLIGGTPSVYEGWLLPGKQAD
ncbi:MAG: hypothetical protein EPO08_02450 [Rhodospirillaceae bacterium]|nr:MAG: hypothetical protein EPO08_02450 [Rhodospirillaceae bacterium]